MGESNPPAPENNKKQTEKEFWSSIFRHFTSWSGAEREMDTPDTQSGFSESARETEAETSPTTDEASQKEVESWIGTLIFQELLNNPELADMNDMEKKNHIKQDLREIKHKIQESDYDRVKAITDKGEPAPWRRNTNWNEARGRYKAAWREFEKWAMEKGVWNKKDDGKEDEKKGDEAEFNRETEVKPNWVIHETARNMGLNVAIAGIYGMGYAMLAPWKAFELGLRYASQLTDNEQYTRGMMEKLFKKKREKSTKGEPKKEEWNKAKEYEVKQKVKKIEMQYIRDLKDQIVEQKAQGGKEPGEEYATITEERKQELRDGAGKRGYENVWRTLRVHWIQEETWDIIDEKEFRDIIHNDFKLRDLLTQEEYSSLRKLKKEETRLKKEIKEDPNHEKKGLDGDLRHTQEGIADIENRKKVRIDKMGWPEYKRGKKKGGAAAESFVVTETEDEMDENEED